LRVAAPSSCSWRSSRSHWPLVDVADAVGIRGPPCTARTSVVDAAGVSGCAGDRHRLPDRERAAVGAVSVTLGPVVSAAEGQVAGRVVAGALKLGEGPRPPLDLVVVPLMAGRSEWPAPSRVV